MFCIDASRNIFEVILCKIVFFFCARFWGEKERDCQNLHSGSGEGSAVDITDSFPVPHKERVGCHLDTLDLGLDLGTMLFGELATSEKKHQSSLKAL